MMTLDQFRALDTAEADQNAARCTWVGNILLYQNPRLRFGANMTGPVDVFKNGQKVTNTQRFDAVTEMIYGGGTTVSARIIRLTQPEVLDGHPWVDIKAGDNNWLHMYQVSEITPFGENVQPGELIPVVYGDGAAKLRIPLTQAIIDENTEFLVRFALSK